MIGKKDRWRQVLFVVFDLDRLVPKDNILRRIDDRVKLAWVRDEVRDSYCEYDGRPSIDPEVALRLMLAGFFYGIVKDRTLMRRAHTDFAIRWFAGYRMDEDLPHHSSLEKIRNRWGIERFRRIFRRIVRECVKAGLVDGNLVHIDATLIRADVSWESLVDEYVDKTIKENTLPGSGVPEALRGQPLAAPKPKRGRRRSKPAKKKKHSKTDPDATMTTSSHNRTMEPCFKQHTAVDDKAGVILDATVTTGETSEGEQLLAQIKRVEENTGAKVGIVTCDAGYAHGKNYAELEQRGTEAVIPPQPENRHVKKIPLRRFKYDAQHQIVRCPRGKILRRSQEDKKDQGWVYRSQASDCRKCPLRSRCLTGKARSRTVKIVKYYEALLRARRRKAKGWDATTKERYNRHRWRAEGKHGEAKVEHGLRRAVRRGLAKVGIQALLTAIAMNLKVLVGPFVAQRNQTFLAILGDDYLIIWTVCPAAVRTSRPRALFSCRIAA